ncbi:PREDICTED: U4/U6.U5 tri-snRNP-associated protein 1 [Rhagoletis zephyria]|uniref:U4/U6.U5 tri-snRNP-associated protein 1 n=1 Tax=Rhagoletis zephyria TaxID=28612 RepID=UPI0008119EE3|nr:PREDICTED: U4/U6.U5 tri-snRNP-associated protein 1 [Rhagoletis zephyria]
MGSSSNGKKHKKDKKHKHRSIDGNEEGESSSTHRHHKHKRHKEHKERHRHKKHKERDREREKERTHHHTEVIALEESDSDDSSDCVEVPLDDQPVKSYERDIVVEREPPPPPKVTKHHIEREKDYERLKDLERAKEREKEREWARERDRERERERYEKEREMERRKEKDMERERAERDRERERERDRVRDREIREKERERMERDRERERERARDREQRPEPDRHHRDRERERNRPAEKIKDRHVREKHSPSPIAENGAGDCLSIEETNKLRAKLGLKPLEVDSGPTKPSSSSAAAAVEAKKVAPGEKELSSYKDEWGEFLHKPASNLKEKAEAEKLREKLKQKKEKRFLEDQLSRIRTLGESDEETDDVSKWVSRNRQAVDEKRKAEKRAKMIEEMDAEFGVNDLVEKEKAAARRKAYSDKHLKGLRVEHDMNEFTEGKTVILTLKDKGVLDEEDDTLVNVNLIDEERYRKNIANKKQNPLSYGYNVYEEQYDVFGNPIERGILEKYDEDLDGNKKRKDFVIGDSLEEEREHRRKLLEIKTKLAGKRLETLEDARIKLASDTFSEAELAIFKKPKKKVKKLRKKLKVEDLLSVNDEPIEQHLGRRRGRHYDEEILDTDDIKDAASEVKAEEEDEDLERILSKARKLRQKENIIKKPFPIDVNSIKHEIKAEPIDGADGEGGIRGADGNIVLNATAEFCRTLGDIPTYGMAGNRDEDSNDMMDFETIDGNDDRYNDRHNEPDLNHGTWNSVNPDEIVQPAEFEDIADNIEEVAILDEEPDVSAGVANALRLALSKGYLEKEEHNRPSNSKMAHLQAKNYSIEDKSAVEDDKFGRRDRFHAGPIMEFKDKDTFKPNVKLEYIDDNGRILNSKEAFRYLSHKFHGKGPGKNKIEKRLKKMEQEGLMKTMSSTDTPLGTLTMLQQKQKETKAPFVVLSGGKQTTAVSTATISKYK